MEASESILLCIYLVLIWEKWSVFEVVIIKLCQPKEEITAEISLTKATPTQSAASTAPRCAPKTRPSRGSRCATWSTAHPREISRITMLSTKSTSTCPRSTSSSSTASPVPSTHVLSVSDQSRSAAAVKANASSDTPPNSASMCVPRLSPAQLLFHWSRQTSSSSWPKTPARTLRSRTEVVWPRSIVYLRSVQCPLHHWSPSRTRLLIDKGCRYFVQSLFFSNQFIIFRNWISTPPSFLCRKAALATSHRYKLSHIHFEATCFDGRPTIHKRQKYPCQCKSRQHLNCL